jgi:hypothetical protein
MSAASMKETTSVLTLDAPNRSGCMQIWRDTVKVINHLEPEVASDAQNRAAASHILERTTCLSMSVGSMDELAVSTKFESKSDVPNAFRSDDYPSNNYTSFADPDHNSPTWFFSTEPPSSWYSPEPNRDGDIIWNTSYTANSLPAPGELPYEDEAISTFHTPPILSTCTVSKTWRYEDDVIPTFRTPPANVLPRPPFCDSIGYGPCVPTNIRPDHPICTHRLGVG